MGFQRCNHPFGDAGFRNHPGCIIRFFFLEDGTEILVKIKTVPSYKGFSRSIHNFVSEKSEYPQHWGCSDKAHQHMMEVLSALRGEMIRMWEILTKWDGNLMGDLGL